jgi:hypothetical protein
MANRPSLVSRGESEEQNLVECCTPFYYIFYKHTGCCCKWLDNDTLFPSHFAETFEHGAEEIWTCNQCSKGFKC